MILGLLCRKIKQKKLWKCTRKFSKNKYIVLKNILSDIGNELYAEEPKYMWQKR